jgi:hypothetical protein
MLWCQLRLEFNEVVYFKMVVCPGTKAPQPNFKLGHHLSGEKLDQIAMLA